MRRSGERRTAGPEFDKSEFFNDDSRVLQMTEEPTIPEPFSGEIRIKVLAAGTGFTDTMIRRGRYPDLKGPGAIRYRTGVGMRFII
jgi:NADPH:quinone reductase-like Zn-dependent oxidoreductase